MAEGGEVRCVQGSESMMGGGVMRGDRMRN